MITNEKISSNHFHLPDTPKDENVAKSVAEDNLNTKEDVGESTGAAAPGASTPSSGLGEAQKQQQEPSGCESESPSALSGGEIAQPANVSINLVSNTAHQQTNMFMPETNNQMNECKAQSTQPALFSNFATDSHDKIWSLLDNSQEFNTQEYSENFNKTLSSFTGKFILL